MATTEEIRRKLEEQATQRVNPLLKGLSMLTGGIAGEFTGTNEQIRQQRQAKRALMEEDLAALQEERMMQRMREQQNEMLKRQLEIDESQRLAATRSRAAEARGQANVLAGQDAMGPFEPAEQAGMETARATLARAEAERIRALEAARPEMTGYLAAQGVQTGEPDIETLQFLTAQQKTKEAMQKEAERKKSGYMQFNIPGVGTIGGSPEQIQEIRKTYPQIGKMIENAGTEESPFSTRFSFDETTGQMVPSISFKAGTPIEKQMEAIKQLQSAFGANQGGAFGNVPAPGVQKPGEEKRKTDIPGYTVRPKM